MKLFGRLKLRQVLKLAENGTVQIYFTYVIKIGFVVFLSGFIGIAVVHAAKPAFKCKNLESSIEELICRDDKLGELDQKVRVYYQSALKKVPKAEVKRLKAMQRGWVKGRNDCWKAQNKRDCMESNYTSRITELQIMAGDVVVPKEIVFDCGQNRRISAYFYNNTQIPAAVLNYDKEQIIAYISRSGSGAKYEGRNVTFWNKGDEATVTWMEKVMQCKVIPSSNL